MKKIKVEPARDNSKKKYFAHKKKIKEKTHSNIVINADAQLQKQ